MPLCWRSHLGTKSLPGSTQELRLNCDLSKNVFALRGPNEVIRSTTRGTGSSTGYLGAATVATAIRSTTARLTGGPVQLQKLFETVEEMKKNAEPIHFVDRVRKIGGFYEQLLTVDQQAADATT